MLRTALRPANLGLLALMLAFAVACGLLGEWQLGRSRDHARVSPTETVVPIGDVLQPASTFTGHADHQRVEVTGTWADVPLELVADRGPDTSGAPGEGRWVVAALAEQRTGALLPVVLGWQPSGDAAPAPPAGPAALTGRLMVSEEPQGVDGDGDLRAMSSADLVNVWPGQLYTGYLLADPGVTGVDDQGGGLTPVPSQAPTPRLDLQNLSYAFQWWLFAVFALVLWVKIVRDRYVDELADARAGADGADGGAADRAVTDGWEDDPVHDSTPDPTRHQTGVSP